MEQSPESDKIVIMNILLAKGANINARNHHGETPLMIALTRCMLKIAKFLLENGADYTIANNNDITALDIVERIMLPVHNPEAHTCYREILNIVGVRKVAN